jgi:hypothetical protein
VKDDDPRHGTTAGHNAGCRLDCCSAAKLRYDKRRKLERERGNARTVPNIGTRRRIRALQALGHSSGAIAAEAGLSPKSVVDLLYRSERVYADAAEGIARAYEVLSMRLADSHFAERSRRAARRKGWAPPLAWPDERLDDPTYEPRGWEYTTPDRADAMRDFAEMGLGITEACRRLKVGRDALEKWCQRHNLSDVYRELAGREALWQNQHTREAS